MVGRFWPCNQVMCDYSSQPTSSYSDLGKKLTSMITMAVKKVRKLDQLDADLERLGRLHVPYGVRPEHYPIVGATLMWTLETSLQSEWNEETKQAWTTFYQIISEKMIKGHTSVAAEEKVENKKGILTPYWPVVLGGIVVGMITLSRYSWGNNFQ